MQIGVGIGIPGMIPLGQRWWPGGASLASDFLNNRHMVNGQEMAFADVYTFTRASSAYRVNASGLLESMATDGPRFDYDPATLLPRGLLIEEARTNALTYSEELDNAAWSLQRATISANAAVAPDGTMTADKIVETTDTGQHLASQLASLTSGMVYTASMYAKAAERTAVAIQWANGAVFGGFGWAAFNLSTGAVIAQTAGVSATITPAGNGWYRCAITSTASATDVDGPGINLYNGGLSYEGDGASGVHVWGAQLEAGAFPTSYIKTEGAAVTRSADVCTRTLGTEFNVSEGTLLLELLAGPAVDDATAHFALSLRKDGNDKLIVHDNGTTGYALASVVGGGVVAQLDPGPVGLSSGDVTKLAFAYKLNDYAASADGGAAVTATSAAVPSGLTDLVLGFDEEGGWFNGWFQGFAIYPRRQPNAFLQGITA